MSHLIYDEVGESINFIKNRSVEDTIRTRQKQLSQ